MRALNDIELFLENKASGRGFSIIRSLDSEGNFDDEIGRAILQVGKTLRDADINRFC